VSDDVLSGLLGALEIAVIERLPNQAFQLLAPPPRWFAGVLESAPHIGTTAMLVGALPYLDHFLRQADPFWRESRSAGGTTPALHSGPFAATVAGEDLLLQAAAMVLGGRMILILESLTGERDTRPMLQRAREYALEQESLSRQLESVRKPAASIDRHVTDLLATTLTPSQRELVQAVQQANHRIQAVNAGRPEPPPLARRQKSS
jgi:hypothetical protein